MHVYFIFSILCNHMFTIFDPYLLLGGVTFNILNKKNHRSENLKFCDESVDHLLVDNKKKHP